MFTYELDKVLKAPKSPKLATPDRIAKLPKWAQEHIAALTQQATILQDSAVKARVEARLHQMHVEQSRTSEDGGVWCVDGSVIGQEWAA